MSSKTLSILLLAQLMGGACAYADWPKPRPPGREIPAPHSPLESPEVLPSGPAISEPTGDLILREALSLTQRAYVEVLSAQVRTALSKQVMDLAAEVAATVAKLVMAGKVSPVEETKAGVAAASVQIELTRAERELEAARKRLAATWGSTAPRFKRALGVLEAVLPRRTPRRGSASGHGLEQRLPDAGRRPFGERLEAVQTQKESR
jgi:hypothetical protein